MRKASKTVTHRSVGPGLTFAVCAPAIVLFALACPVRSALAQSTGDESGLAKPHKTWQTFYLAHATSSTAAMEITTALRNVIQHCCVDLTRSDDAISVYGTPEDLQLARQIVSDLDRPSPSWRLTYTLTRTGGDYPGTQRLSVIVASGSKTELRQGTRIPLVTGTYGKDSTPADSTRIQYVDIGLGLSAGLEGSADDLRLQTKIELTGLSDEKSSVGAQDPVIRQIVLETTSGLAPGKPLALGSIDLPGAAGREAVSVTVEPLPEPQS